MPNIQSYNSQKLSKLTANRSKFFMPIVAFIAVIIIGFAGLMLFQKVTGTNVASRFIKIKEIKNEKDMDKFNTQYDSFSKDFDKQEPPSSIFK